jgi:hypothetical protein
MRYDWRMYEAALNALSCPAIPAKLRFGSM